MNDSTEQGPRIWLIRSYRAGENSQIAALADELGYDYEVKTLHYRRIGFIPDLLRQITLAGIDRSQSSPLQPPWPDLVISAGLRNEPVCRWIKRQSRNHTCLIHIGRPWAGLDQFDLVITTPQYRLPEHANVLHNELTLNGITEERLSAARSTWKPRLSYLPAPYLAVMIGGNSGPYSFGPHTAEQLGKAASRLATEMGGSLIVSTSARTPRNSIEHLKSNLSVANYFFAWSPDRKENPYLGFLALAQEIIVTVDSVAMLSEACATHKPVYIFDPSRTGANDVRVGSMLYKLMMKFGHRRFSRDTGLIHQQQINAGRAVWLGDTFPSRDPDKPQDMQRAVGRVQKLLHDP